ncbi:WEB family protein At5g16730, chloroplastic-like [Magnolia sinica]|uniref:WEB family protein At5g16730, chloroplastic-like n=1 Tax=Magnolia sinica TaxID=86752 RepID=UPI0026594523|nr:WEB family protein At5g16730, chloroplastic-like [Magnolia sinica]XP_058087173.1 WEB family protein At5g16730, chloroplastic-like [Magnolia sinica]
MTEIQVTRGSDMQLKLNRVIEDLKKTKDQLEASEEEKCRILDELKEMKKVAEDANLRLSEALLAQGQVREIEKVRVNELERASFESAQKRDQAWQLELEAVQKQHDLDVEALSTAAQELNRVNRELSFAISAKNKALKEAEDARLDAETNANWVKDLSMELCSLKELLESANASHSVVENMSSDSDEELETRKSNGLATQNSSVIELLNLQLKKAKDVEEKLAEREILIEELKMELHDARESESGALDLLSESKKRIEMLALELEKSNESETKSFNSFLALTKQLEETKISLQESKLKIASLHENIESMEISFGLSSRDPNVSSRCLVTTRSDMNSGEETIKTLESELQTVKEDLVYARGGEELALSNTRSLAKEMSRLRNELKLATEAEEQSRKAMDDLALALKEVTTEANQVKEKLASTESELDDARMETERVKIILRSTEAKFQALLDEARREIKRVEEAAERLKLEAEESNTAWNGKEVGFVHCMKMSEEEIADAKEENDMLIESLKEAEIAAKMAREENARLRDILKHALNEATVSKEAAEIARAENSQLKDNLSDLVNALHRIRQENELHKIKEATSLENEKELKSSVAATSTTASRKSGNLSVPKGGDAKDPGASKKPHIVVKEARKSATEQSKELEILRQERENQRIKNGYNDVDVDPELLEGSIFEMPDSPDQDCMFQSVNGRLRHRSLPSILTDDAETVSSDDFEHTDGDHFDEAESNRSSEMSHRRKKALLRRFGDLIRRRSSYTK